MIKKWPYYPAHSNRFFVPDLSPEQRSELKSLKPKLVFVAESPHEREVAPEQVLDRRPLCGKAGQEWWKMVGALVAGDSSQDTSLERLLSLCKRAQIAVLNAVQYPLDPKIVTHYGPEADPASHLGFSKVAPSSFKKLRGTAEVRSAIEALQSRLCHPSLVNVPVISLGNDAKWFVEQALGLQSRHLQTIPHPSAWWRRGGFFREKAQGQLSALLKQISSSRELHLGL